MERVQLYPVSPKLTASDFRDVDLLYETIIKILPSKKNSVAGEAVLVFPEYIGLGFFISQGGESALKASTVSAAMGELIRNRLTGFAWHFFKTYLDFFVGPTGQRIKRAIFQTYASDVWPLYQALFSGLSEAHQSWVVAGSILLPQLELGKHGWGLVGDQLYNQSVIFNPKGEIAGVVQKIHLTPDEAGFVNAGSPGKWQPVTTNWGKIAVMICADCWYPDMFARALELGATHYAVPAMVSPNTAWNAPWGGYQPKASTPSDIPAGLVGQITEAEAWERFGLEGRLKAIRHQGGVISQFQGEFLDLTASGESKVIR